MSCPNEEKEILCSACKEWTTLCEPCCPRTHECEACRDRQYEAQLSSQLADACDGGSSYWSVE